MLLAHTDAHEPTDQILLKRSSVELESSPVIKQQDSVVDTTPEESIDISSVITQVTSTEDAFATPCSTRGYGNDGQSGKVSWKGRFRSFFCCFAPGFTSYHKGPDGEVDSLPQFANAPSRQYPEPVIGQKREEDLDKKTLVLDLDETLVHSSFKPIPNPDYIIPVDIEGKMVDVFVLKRPWLDNFLDKVGPRFEIVVFTASLAKYADPLLDLLDKDKNNVRWRLFRESCCLYEGNYVKDLNCLGRDLASTIIVDNSPHSYVFQPLNAVPISTFIDDMEDQELLQILPTILGVEKVPDVRHFLGPNLANIEKAKAITIDGYVAQATSCSC